MPKQVTFDGVPMEWCDWCGKVPRSEIREFHCNRCRRYREWCEPCMASAVQEAKAPLCSSCIAERGLVYLSW